MSLPCRSASKPARLAFIAICGLALGWRLLGITSTEVWRDEAVTLLHARLGWWELLSRLWSVEDTPPASFLIFKLACSCWSNVIWVRLWPVAAGVAAVAVLMALVRRIHPRAWWAAGLLAAFSPLPVHYSQELRAYSFLSLAAVCSLYAACRAVEAPQQRGWFMASAALAALAAHMHAVGLFLFPAVLVWAVSMAGFRQLRAWLAPSLAWLLLALPIIWFAAHWSGYHQGEPDWWVPAMPGAGRAIQLAGEFTGHEGIAQWERARSEDRSSAGSAVMWTAFAAERGLALAWAVLAITDARLRRPAMAFVGAAAAFIGLLALTSSLGVPNIMIRTLLVPWWPLMAAASLGVSAAGRAGRAIGIAALAVILVLNAAYWPWRVRAGPPRRPASEAGMSWMSARLRPADLLVIDEPWYEDQVVYRLGASVAADQIWTPAKPVYQGRPPVHLLRARERDPNADARLRAELDRRANDGTPYSVWVIRPWWSWDMPQNSPEAVVADRLRETARFASPQPYTLTITRYSGGLRPPTSLPAASEKKRPRTR